MPVNRPEGDFTTIESAPIGHIRTVTGPSRPVGSIAENEITWRLISHLSLNYLAMTDLSDEEGAATLRELMGRMLTIADSAGTAVPATGTLDEITRMRGAVDEFGRAITARDQAIAKLKETQAELVQAGKMAALGNL